MTDSLPSLAKGTLGRRIALPVVALVLVLSVAVGALIVSNARFEGAGKAHEHSDRILTTTFGVFQAVIDAEIGVRGYLITGDPRLLAPWRSAMQVFSGAVRTLRELNPDPGLRAFVAIGAAYLHDYAAPVVVERRAGRIAPRRLYRLVMDGGRRVDELRSKFTRLQSAEAAERQAVVDAATGQAHTTRTFAVSAFGASLLLLIWLLALLARVVVRPIRHLRAAARRMAGGDHAVRVEPASARELREVGLAFNALGESLLARDAMIDGHTAALETKVAERTEELENSRLDSLRRLAVASEYRDDDTHEHAARVGRTSQLIAQGLGLSPVVQDLINQAAPLHDVGKIGVSDTILLKPGKLTPDERAQMERHSLIGADILADSESPVLKLAEQIALTHHECWDGTGYPNRLRGDRIPLPGRIVAVADVFDALTHQRPYKEAWPVSRAVEQIIDESATHFDPHVVAAFAKLDHDTLNDPIEDRQRWQRTRASAATPAPAPAPSAGRAAALGATS